jgi:hypothetical protein
MADLNDQNIELGLKFQIRHGADITPGPVDADGTVHYTAPSGFESTSTDTSPPHTAVNFDYVVNTGLNGSTSTLADFDFKMIIAQTQGAVTQTVTFDLDPATHFWVAEGSTPAGFGADDFHSGTAPSATTVSQVAENSENFKFIQNAFGETTAQMSATNTKYDITLEALDHAHNILGSAHSVLLLV